MRARLELNLTIAGIALAPPGARLPGQAIASPTTFAEVAVADDLLVLHKSFAAANAVTTGTGVRTVAKKAHGAVRKS